MKIEKDGKVYVYIDPIPQDGLTDEELEGIAIMFLAFGELTERLEKLKKESISVAVERSNLGYLVVRDKMPYCFVPSSGMFERLMKSCERLPHKYRDELSKIEKLISSNNDNHYGK